jgi:predicted RNase H-like HicB family nuclease
MARSIAVRAAYLRMRRPAAAASGMKSRSREMIRLAARPDGDKGIRMVGNEPCRFHCRPSDRLEAAMTTRSVFVYVERDRETGFYVGVVPGVHGAHSQGATLDELRENMEEVLQLCLEEGWLSAESIPEFAAIQQLEVAV